MSGNQAGEGKDGKSWRLGLTCIPMGLTCVDSIANENLLYSPGNATPCSVVT